MGGSGEDVCVRIVGEARSWGGVPCARVSSSEERAGVIACDSACVGCGVCVCRRVRVSWRSEDFIECSRDRVLVARVSDKAVRRSQSACVRVCVEQVVSREVWVWVWLLRVGECGAV